MGRLFLTTGAWRSDLIPQNNSILAMLETKLTIGASYDLKASRKN
jgi:hypothetical protein